MQWFRFYTEAINDKKLRRIARDNNESMAHVLGVWAIVLSIASDSPQRGVLLLSDIVPATIDDISDAAGCNVTETFRKLCVTGLVTETVTNSGETVYAVPAWEKRQFSSDSSVTRVREHRERKKSAQKGENVTEVKRYRNAPDPDPDPDPDLSSSGGGSAPPAVDYAQITKAYQAEIGMCTSIISDAIKSQLAAGVPGGWIVKAIGIAAANEKRSWSYADSIIERWKLEGFDGDMDRKSRSKGSANSSNNSRTNGRANGAGPASKVSKSMDAVDRVEEMIRKGGTL